MIIAWTSKCFKIKTLMSLKYIDAKSLLIIGTQQTKLMMVKINQVI